ncbi:HlyD family efflux transporter periplasmic adaptor subunit [Cyanobacteria bacterium FACHB-502]|nr:HlyD family efflux transporter periplasmic adaptor subunit [Cyanobacteria bacterium FACHB-502]
MVNHIHPISIQPLNSQDLLPPISRWTSLGGLVLVGTIGVAISLSAIVRYNVVVRANATIRPAGELRIVQAEIEGSVKQIAVKDHQQVRQGDTIAYLDDTKLQIQKSQLQGSIQQNQTQVDQVTAQIRFLDAQMAAESYSTERSIAAAQAQTVRNQRDYVERSITAEAEVQEAQVALEQAQDEWNRYLQLAATGAVSSLQLKEKESAARTAEARLERAKASINPTNASVIVAEEGIAQERARGRATLANLQKEREALVQRQAEIQVQIIRDQKELEQVERDLRRSIIRATSDGTVFQLNIQNPNQVIRSGDTIAQIVPTHTLLVVRANVANQDIDRVEVGQIAQVRVDACPYSDYGVLEGKVQTIAPDAGSAQNSTATPAPTQTNGTSGTFAVTIAIENPAFGRGQQQCQLQSGMQASASIISKQETFLQFVLRKARLWTDL